MTALKKFETPQDFLDYNEETLNSQYFQHFHLHRLFDDLKKGRDKLYEAYNIIDDDSSNVIVVWVEKLIFIYAAKWNETVLSFIEKELIEIDTSKFIFRGQKEIILQIMEKMKFKYSVINDRVIYDCTSVKPISKKINGKFGIATTSDITTILRMSVNYYDEEFEGKGQQSEESVIQSAYAGVKDSSIYKWSANGRIVSIARTLGNHIDNAMIGGLFTRTNERKKGYAYFLISKLTQHLLDNGIKKCGLLTEATKVATNKIFERAGYQNVYNWVNILIN